MDLDKKVSDRDRCPTGIDGLDNILDGGIPRGNTILFTGSCGTGKTTLSLEFLVHVLLVYPPASDRTGVTSGRKRRPLRPYRYDSPETDDGARPGKDVTPPGVEGFLDPQ